MSQPRNSTLDEVKAVDHLPFIPPRIKIQYLCANGKLLPDVIIDFLKERLKEYEPCRISKNDIETLGMRLPCGIIVDHDGLYAIYREKNEALLNKGGTFGAVKLGQNLETGEWKVLKTQKFIHPGRKKIFSQEHQNLSDFDETGKAIIRSSKKSKCENGDMLEKGNFFMPYVKGIELYTLMNNRLFRYTYDEDIDFNNDPLENKIKFELKLELEYQWPDLFWLDIAILIANAVNAFHERGRLHCDVKQENIIINFLDEPERAKLVDMGSAMHCVVEGSVLLREQRGTLEYIGPELLPDQKNTYSAKTDIFALGVLLQEVLMNQRSAMFRFSDTDPAYQQRYFFYYGETAFHQSTVLNQLIHDMQHDSPDKRPSMKTIISQLENYRKEYVEKYPKQVQQTQDILKKIKLAEKLRMESIQECLKQQRTEKQTTQQSTVTVIVKLGGIRFLTPLKLKDQKNDDIKKPVTLVPSNRNSVNEEHGSSPRLSIKLPGLV